MNYALGCAFRVEDLLYNFPYKKLKTNCALCYELIKDNHRDILVARVFRSAIKLVIADIVNNNATFWLPLTGARKCNMHMIRVTGNAFKALRRAGKWNAVDIINSNFSGYLIGFFMFGKRTPRVKNVYINKEFRDIITDKTNLGFNYGDSKNDRYVKDYYQLVYELYPKVPKEDIRTILSYCWKSLYLHNSYGGDTSLRDGAFWFYIGNLKKNAILHFLYYKRKLAVKLKVLYKRKKIPFDGYFYFALPNAHYLQYLQQKCSKGRPRKHFTFKSVMLYLIEEECLITESEKLFIFKVYIGYSPRMRYYVPELKTSKASLVKIRRPLKFKDILAANHKYEFI